MNDLWKLNKPAHDTVHSAYLIENYLRRFFIYCRLKFFYVLEIDPNAFKSLILSAVEDHFGHKLSPGDQPDAFRRNKEDLYAKVRVQYLYLPSSRPYNLISLHLIWSRGEKSPPKNLILLYHHALSMYATAQL
jgi:hypothetical protein